MKICWTNPLRNIRRVLPDGTTITPLGLWTSRLLLTSTELLALIAAQHVEHWFLSRHSTDTPLVRDTDILAAYTATYGEHPRVGPDGSLAIDGTRFVQATRFCEAQGYKPYEVSWATAQATVTTLRAWTSAHHVTLLYSEPELMAVCDEWLPLIPLTDAYGVLWRDGVPYRSISAWGKLIGLNGLHERHWHAAADLSPLLGRGRRGTSRYYSEADMRRLVSVIAETLPTVDERHVTMHRLQRQRRDIACAWLEESLADAATAA